MKQKSLKHRQVLQILKAKLEFASKLFIPPKKESSLKNRVQVVPKKKAWNHALETCVLIPGRPSSNRKHRRRSFS